MLISLLLCFAYSSFSAAFTITLATYKSNVVDRWNLNKRQAILVPLLVLLFAIQVTLGEALNPAELQSLHMWTRRSEDSQYY